MRSSVVVIAADPARWHQHGPYRPMDALLLVGHGSGRYPDATRVIEAHAASLRARSLFTEVAVGLLQGQPTAAGALMTLSAPTIHVVPFFMEDGYFTRTVVPRVLRDTSVGRSLHVCPPVGVHGRIAALIEGRARSACGQAGILPAALTVILLAHGSARAPGRLMAAHAHAAQINRRGVFADVRVAFLEEAPFLPDVLPLVGQPVGVVGLFASAGGHARDDAPRLIAEASTARGAPLLDLGFIGDDPAMPEIILDQVAARRLDQATPGPAGRL